MKVIDLINDYSNGKELPEKIKVHGTEFIHDCYLCYKSQAFDREQYLFTEDYNWSDWLNEEVEVIENEKIEKLPTNDGMVYATDGEMILVVNKINEIIDKINSMED